MKASSVGLMMLVLGVFGVAGTRLGGFGVDKWGTARMISFSLVVSAAALAFLPIASASLVLGVSVLVIWMFSIFVTAPALQTYFVQQAPQSSNFVLSINTSITHLGVAIGAGAGGLIVSSTSTVIHNPWISSSTYAIGLAIVIVSFLLRKRSVSEAV
jgi:DHA1 family putative efflux transporter-like MFS transporter